MDRELPAATRRAHRLRTVGGIVLPAGALALVIVLLPGWMRPTLTRARVRIAVVEAGPIEAVLTAAGTVMPEVERVLWSPVEARLLRLLKPVGARVSAGDLVAELDLGDSQLALDRIAADLSVAENRQEQARLALAASLSEIDARIERKALDVDILREKATSSARLFEEKLLSSQGLADARSAAKSASIELEQLHRERAHAERSAQLQADGLSLERAALVREAGAARRTIELATMRSDRDGVVTWALAQEGALVRRGEVVARVADLRAFRIDATISDVHSGRIRAGMPVNVSLNDTLLPGTISDVSPTVEQNVVAFTVRLEDSSHPALRPQLRLDVHVVTERKPRTLRVRQGPFATGPDRVEAFVIRGDRAVRTTVGLGVRSAHDVEVLSGLAEGDEVVISDMRDYLHLPELEVR